MLAVDVAVSVQRAARCADAATAVDVDAARPTGRKIQKTAPDTLSAAAAAKAVVGPAAELAALNVEPMSARFVVAVASASGVANTNDVRVPFPRPIATTGAALGRSMGSR